MPATQIASLSRSPLRARVIRASTTVHRSRRHTFHSFTGDMASWWPVLPFSAGQARVRRIELEPCIGGRLREVWRDGTELSWGTVRSWEPPRRLALDWAVGTCPTEVEIKLDILAPGLARVALEHRPPEDAAPSVFARSMPGEFRACAASWRRVLAAFAVVADCPDF